MFWGNGCNARVDLEELCYKIVVSKGAIEGYIHSRDTSGC
jgi:hypothetical protein